MKKILLSIMTIFIFNISMLGSSINIVNAAQEGASLHAQQQLVGSTGLVTGNHILSRQCGFLEDFSEKLKEKQATNKDSMLKYEKEDVSLKNISGVFNNLIIDTGFSFVNGIAFAAMAAGSGACGIDASAPAEQNFLKTIFNQTQVFTELSNITWIAGLMSIVGIAQWFALLMMTFLILFKGWQAFRGKQIDPLGLVLRFTVAMTLIYLAPYVLQDILNINNIFSHYLSNMQVSLLGPDNTSYLVRISEVLPASIIIVVMQIQELMIASVQSISDGSTQDAVNMAMSASLNMLMLVVVVLIILIMLLIPFFKLIIWWYVRFFKIFVFTAISPFMFMTFADEETEKTGYNFIKNFSITVFEQFFMILGIALTGVFIGSVLPLMDTLGLGLIGTGIAIYAAISFLGTLPDVIGAWFQGGSGVRDNGTGMASNIIKSAKSNASSARRNASSGIKKFDSMKQSSNVRRDSKTNSVVRAASEHNKQTKINTARYGDKVGKQVTPKPINKTSFKKPGGK